MFLTNKDILTKLLVVLTATIINHIASSEDKIQEANDPYHNIIESKKAKCPSIQPEYISPSGSRKKRLISTSRDNGNCYVNNQSISLSAQFAIEGINSFKDDYTKSLLDLSWSGAEWLYPDTEDDLLYIGDSTGEIFQVLPAIPQPPHYPPSTLDDLQVILVQTFGFIQRYSVAFEILFLDEFLNEDSFLKQLQESRKNLVGVLDELETSLVKCDLVPDQELLKSLIEKSYYAGFPSGQIRGQRGFRTLRQCLLGLQYIVDVFPVDGCVESTVEGGVESPVGDGVGTLLEEGVDSLVEGGLLDFSSESGVESLVEGGVDSPSEGGVDSSVESGVDSSIGGAVFSPVEGVESIVEGGAFSPFGGGVDKPTIN